MDATYAGRCARRLEPLHSFSYFAAEVQESLVGVGLENSGMTYFASRAGAMGAVTAPVVAATFFTFNPELVGRFVPRAWAQADPAEIVTARYTGVDRALRRILGEQTLSSPSVAEAADLAGIAAGAAEPGGRPLFAAHAAVDWPEPAHLRLWHALALLREYRGDGHIAALQAAGLGPMDALVTHTATGTGFTVKAARARRGWSAEQWDAAVAHLTDIELLDGRGELSELGVQTREAVEDLTDDLAAPTWAELGEDGVERLVELCDPLCEAVFASGVFPANVFGPRWGRS